MRLLGICAVIGIGLLASAPLSASGRLGIYAIVEKVVFEPSEAAAERIQLWGAFMYVSGGVADAAETSPPRKGYLYFRLPPVIGGRNEPLQQQARTEWNDLKAVAGTGQVVGFGAWWYFGEFSALQPDRRTFSRPFIAETISPGGAVTDLRVRPASEPPADPAMYQTNVGVVKLTEASHATLIRQLRTALK